jgi:hypothetical protein
VGRDDFIAPPSQAERILRGIVGAELVVFEDCGHYPYAERPDAFEAAVRAWLGQVWPNQLRPGSPPPVALRREATSTGALRSPRDAGDP